MVNRNCSNFTHTKSVSNVVGETAERQRRDLPNTVHVSLNAEHRKMAIELVKFYGYSGLAPLLRHLMIEEYKRRNSE